MAKRVIDESEGQLAMVQDPPVGGAIVQQPVTFEAALATVAARGGSPEEVERWLNVYERMQAAKAKVAFEQAFAKFKAECPTIVRNAVSQFKKKVVDRDGNVVEVPRMYADLDGIAVVKPTLAANGLTYRWGDAELAEGGKYIRIRCIISHVGGHSESASALQPIESAAGCSASQKMGSAESYAMRYALLRVLGETPGDDDDDGNGPAAAPDAGPKITDHQAANITAMLDELGPKVNRAKFLAYFSIEKVADLPASRFREVMTELEKKQRGGA